MTLPQKKIECDHCSAPLDLAGAEARGEAFVICDYCGTQSVENTKLEGSAGMATSGMWEMDGKRFKTFEALERYLRAQHGDELADQMIAFLAKNEASRRG